MSAVGFDIGNENSYVAVVRSGGIEILDNEYSLRATPTYIAFNERTRDVGIGAKVKISTNLENTVFGFKRILGKTCNDSNLCKELEYLPHKIEHSPSGGIGIKVNYLNDNYVFSATQLMAMMLNKLKMISENKVSGKIRDCVISVPVYYTDAQRRAMLAAAKIANLNALNLMNESTAVALAFGYYKHDLSERPQNVIFIDMGNSAVTVTACAFTKEKLKILGSVWDNVGGRDFDNLLVQYFVREFMDKYKINVLSSKKALMTLLLECESLKRLMSASSLELRFQIECFMDDLDVSGQMKRETFESMSVHLLKRIEETFQRILDKTELSVNDIHSIEIVGGSCRIPAVRQLIYKVFNREPNSTLNQDEAVAKGCALQCALLSPALKTRNFIIEDMPSFDIQVIWDDMRSNQERLVVFSSRDKVPAFKMISFGMDYQFTFNVFQIDRTTLERMKIGTFAIGNFPENMENGLVKVKVSIDGHSIFKINGATFFPRNDPNKAIALPCKEKNPDTPDDYENVDTIDTLGQHDSASQSYELSVSSELPELSQKELDYFIEVEKQMIDRYISEKLRSDARNALEEYIYDVKSKLKSEWTDFIEDKNKNKLTVYLDETENWLYENEEETVEEFSKKLTKSKSLFDPIFKKCTEWEQRSELISEYHQILQHSLSFIGEVTQNHYIDLYPDDVEKLQNLYRDAKQYLIELTSSLSNLKKFEHVPAAVEDIRKCLHDFQYEFQKYSLDLKKKLLASNKPVMQTGDVSSGLQENSANDSQAVPEI